MQDYIEKVKKIISPSFKQIREIGKKSISHLSEEKQNALYDKLKRGVALLDSHEVMCKYLISFGNMHEAKIQDAVKYLPKEIFENNFEIVDWGCGQGIGTVCFFDYLKKEGFNINVEKVTLIEPSDHTLARAALHVEAYLGADKKVVSIKKFLDEVTVEDIKPESNLPRIHFFSNILDIPQIDLKILSQKINGTILNDNFIVSVGPLNAGNRRIDAFYSYFKVLENHLLHNFEISQFFYGGYSSCTYKAKVYKLECNKIGNLIPIDFYPSVQFHAAYILDGVSNEVKQLKKEEIEEFNNFISEYGRFELETPFDLGANVYEDVHPVLAVLNNIVTRGIPTKSSPYLEQVFCDKFNLSQKISSDFELNYKLNKKIGLQELIVNIAKSQTDSFIKEHKKAIQFLFTPIAIARIQKVVLEALMTEKIDLNQNKWSVLVEEKDVPCAALAFKDLELLFNNLTQLSEKYNKLKFPEIELTVITPALYIDSKLHVESNVVMIADEKVKKKIFDLVIVIDLFNDSQVNKETFSKYKTKNNGYFIISKALKQRRPRKIYTSDLIEYKEVVIRDEQGRYSDVSDPQKCLKFFLQLLFRKIDFRPGQLPILNRALKNNSVIGLLPTGGGKSLTYQIAALLQPGVTLVIDPLSSLMKDQFDGLINAGIDCCTYINSSIDRLEKSRRELQLEHSELLFVFLSPERLGIYKFREKLKNMHDMNVYFSYGVLDEVHCVSEWGHDFRFTYLHLGRNIYKYVRAKKGTVSLFGLTATASFDVLADVERELSAEGAYNLDADTVVRYENTNRLELQYKIEKVSVKFAEDPNFDRNQVLDSSLSKAVNINAFNNSKAFHSAKNLFLTNYIKKIPEYIRELQSDESLGRIKTNYKERQEIEESIDVDLRVDMPNCFYKTNTNYEQAGIIFCPHKKNTGISVNTNKESLETIAPDTGSFFGSDSSGNSMRNLELFRENKQPIMVATKAFGMGIDKPNVRFTVNMNYSSSLESFIQEAGRAGRDRKIALAVILHSDFHLARINGNAIEHKSPMRLIQNKWFNHDDLISIINFYKLVIKKQDIDHCTSEKDFTKLKCEIKNGQGDNIYAKGTCEAECKYFENCNLPKANLLYRTYWTYSKDMFRNLKNKGLDIEKKHIAYQNSDYETVMYFYNNSFKGAIIEQSFMEGLLLKSNLTVFKGDDAEFKPTKTSNVYGFLETLLNAKEGEEIVSFVNYIKPDLLNKKEGTDTDISKAIYRMSCIELIEDFTQDYRNNRFRIVSRRKKEGDYFKGLTNFLKRYFNEDRALQEVVKARNYSIKQSAVSSIETEVHKCLAYLTEFVYVKISEKRKRAIDDMRRFCLTGLNENVDWKETNEVLKEDIHYYFNSKYARNDYVADTGENYSLTKDTDSGKNSQWWILLKYLKVINDDLVGPGTPIDNVKHLQGAVRLIRRSLTDKNPALDLLNAFCLFFLGINNNSNLENELVKTFKEGAHEFQSRKLNNDEFWNNLEDYCKTILPNDTTGLLKTLKAEVTLEIHEVNIKLIEQKYLS
jgi:superfamily II DNA helicase RecQ